jgi:predicted nucleic acid-binding protein
MLRRALLDTGIVLRDSNTQDAQHSLVTRSIGILLSSGWELCIVPQCIYEFWSVATRPAAVNGLGFAPPDARGRSESLLAAFTLLPDPPDLVHRWLELCERYGVSGRQAHDARLVAAMLAHGVTHILTLNGADFRRYAELTVLEPGALPPA